MNPNARLEMINKARYIYGLANILKCDVDILRKEISELNEDKIRESIKDANDILQKLTKLVSDLEDILNLD